MAESGDVVQQFQCDFVGFRDRQPPMAAQELCPNPRSVGRSPEGGSAHPRLLAQHVPGPAARFLALPLLALPLFFVVSCGAFFSIGSAMVFSSRAALFDSWSSCDATFLGFACTLNGTKETSFRIASYFFRAPLSRTSSCARLVPVGPIQHNEPGIEVAKLPQGRITISILRPQAQLFRSVPDPQIVNGFAATRICPTQKMSVWVPSVTCSAWKPVAHATRAMSRSLNFWILPVEVFGISTNNTRRGIL